MDNKINKFFNKQITVKKGFTIKMFDLFFVVCITLAGILLRALLFNIESRDFIDFLSGWYDEIGAVKGFRALGVAIGNYNPPYLYLMKLMTLLPMRSLFAVKLFSCIFDFAAALLIMVIVYRHFKSVSYALGAYGVFLLAPTVLLNGAAWSQCDIIYSFFLLWCVYSFIKNKPFLASILFGIAFSFKLQAIFLAPLLIWMWLAGRVKIKHLLMIPAVFLASLLPAWFAGRPLKELLGIYVSQTGTYNSSLTLNYPNIYTFLGDQYVDVLSKVGILFTACLLGLLLYLMFSTKARLTADTIITFSLFVAMLIPYFLPFMHDRYGFLADVLVILYVFFRPSKIPAAIVYTMVSLLAYGPYLFGIKIIPFQYVALAYLFVICYVGADLLKQCVPQSWQGRN